MKPCSFFARGLALLLLPTAVFSADDTWQSRIADGLGKAGSDAQITALHNHLLRNEPFTMYMHVRGHGEPGKLASSLRYHRPEHCLRYCTIDARCHLS